MEEIYYLKPSELLLSYTDFKELIKKVKPKLSKDDISWLGDWDMLDLSFSPMDDEQRKFIRYGHYLGWHAFQQSVNPT